MGETLKIVKKYGCRRMASESANHNDIGSANGNSNIATNAGNTSGLVVNLNPTTSSQEDHRSPRRIAHRLLNPDRPNHLPMPPPYTSREPSILQHPMSPPPRYTSTLGLDNVIETNQALHVNIPEEQDINNPDSSEANPHPPTYQEAISARDDQTDENKK